MEDNKRDKDVATNKILYRAATVEQDKVNEKERTVELSFSSEEPVLRHDARNTPYFEVLGHSEGEVDKSFIGNGQAPLLMEHDRKVQIGVVQSVDVIDGRGLARIRLSRSALATEILNDIVDGIRTNISVGYSVAEQKRDGKRGDTDVVRVTSWKPMEVSFVSIPADTTVGVGRADELQATTKTNDKEIQMTEERKEATTPTVDVEAVKREAAQSEQARVKDILTLGAKYDQRDKAEEFVKNNKTADLFREFVLENLDQKSSKTEIKASEGDAELGLTRKEVKNYSFIKLLRALANPSDSRAQEDAAFEIECSRAAEKVEGRTARGLILPYDVMATRALDGTTGDGAELIGTDHLAGSFIDLLRNELVIGQFNPTMLTGLVGNASIPGQATSAASNWFDPAAMTDGAETELTTRAVPLSPKYVRAVSAIARNTLNQATPSVEQMVRDDLIRSLATSIDLAVFYGSGASSQPTGIQTAVTQITTRFAGAVPTFAELVAMKKELATANALRGNVAYVTDPGTAADLEVLPKDAGSGIFVLENGRAAGFPVVSSNQITAGDVFIGNYQDVVIASWGGLDVTVDTAKYAGSGGLRVIAIQDVDIALRHVASFAWNNDTA